MSNIIKVRNNEGEWIGIPALSGADGITPHIGENGHWFIGETDTGVIAGGLTEIPMATTNTLGGIKVGANLQISEDGTLSAIDSTDLTNYATKTDVENAIDEIVIPTKVSELTNDSGFITTYTETDPLYTADKANIALKAELPTKVSDLTNDTGFITNTVNNLTQYYTKAETYTQSEVNSLINSITTLTLQVVTTLPTSNISTTTIYLKSITGEDNNNFEEWIYVNNKWELIGTTKVDLSSYATKEYVDSAINELDVYSKSETDAKITELIAANATNGTPLSTFDRIIYKAAPGNIVPELLRAPIFTWADESYHLPTELWGILDILCQTEVLFEYGDYNTIDELLERFKNENALGSLYKTCVPYTASNGSTYSDLTDVMNELSTTIVGYNSEILGLIYVDIDVISGSSTDLCLYTSTGTIKYRLNARDDKALVTRVTYTPTKIDELNVLYKTNTREYTPIEDYNPATKKYVDDAVANIDLPEVSTKEQLPAVGESKIVETLDGNYTISNLGEKIRTVYTTRPCKDTHYFDGYADIQTRIEWGTSYAGTSFDISYGNVVKTITFGDNEGVYDGEELVEDVAALFENKITEAFGANVIKVYGNDVGDYGRLVFYYKNPPQQIITILGGTTLPLLGIESNVSTCRLDGLTVKTVTKTSAAQFTVDINEYSGIFSTDITLADLIDAINAANTDVRMVYDFANDVFTISASTETINYDDSIGLLRDVGFNTDKTVTQESAGYELSVIQPDGQTLSSIVVNNSEFDTGHNISLLYLLQKVTNNDIINVANTSYTLPAIGSTQEIETLEGKYALKVIENATLSRVESTPIAENARVEGIMSSDFCEFPTYLENTSFYMTVNGNTQLIAFGPGEGNIDMDMFEVAPIFQEKIDAIFGTDQVKVTEMVLPFGFQIGFESADDVSNHIIVTSGGDTDGYADALELLYITSGSTNRLNMSLTIGEYLQTTATEMIVTLGARDNRAHSINPQTMTLQGFFDWLNNLPIYNFHISYETHLDKIVLTRMNGDVLVGDNLYFFNGLGLIDGINMSAEEFETIKQYDSRYSELPIINVELTQPNGTVITDISLTETEFAFDGNFALMQILTQTQSAAIQKLEKELNEIKQSTGDKKISQLTIPTTGWTTLSTGGGTIELDLAEITANDDPIINLIYTDDDNRDAELNGEWSKISRIKTLNGKIKLYAYYEIPAIELSITIRYLG